MPRPRKQSVDWFPHMVTHGKTMFILEGRHGVQGYAFWFKLLELLGASEGHYFDCNYKANWEYLQGRLGADEEVSQKILDLLAKLDAIDASLWKKRVIWSDNFVSGVEVVYRNRRVDVPKRPDHLDNNGIEGVPSGAGNVAEMPLSPVDGASAGAINTVETPLSPVDYHQKPPHAGVSTSSLPVVIPIVEESRVEKNKTTSSDSSGILTNGFSLFWDCYPKKVGKGAALKKWATLIKTKKLPPIETVVNAVTEQRTWTQWQKDDGQFIPNPTTWLNEGRWDDEKPEGGKEWYA